MRAFIVLLPILTLAACAPRPVRVLRADGDLVATWSDADRAKPIAVRPLRADDRHSAMLVRLAGAERPHLHADHDLTVVLISGSVRMHLGGRDSTMAPGDVAEIPRGVAHWAQNLAADASVAYVVSTPAYDPADTVPVDPSGR